jgi:hypothetical protein
MINKLVEKTHNKKPIMKIQNTQQPRILKPIKLPSLTDSATKIMKNIKNKKLTFQRRLFKALQL